MHFLLAQFQNQFLSGGLLLLLSGSIIALLRKTPDRIFEWIKRRLTVEVEIQNSDPLFDYVTFWLDTHPYSRRSRKLTATLAPNDSNNANGPVETGNSGHKTPPKVIFSPAPGHHVFVYGGRIVWMSRNREGSPAAGVGTSGLKKVETYHFTVLGRSQSGVREMIEEIVRVGTRPSDSIRVFSSRFGYWQSFGVIKPRTLDSVVLPEGDAELILEDVGRFLSQADWYRSVGIPWHRGYLLYGIPGSGKTSLVSALAGEMKMDLYLLNISGSGMDDERLQGLMADIRPGTMVLMEDIDCTFPDRDQPKDAKRVTLSGLLNCLDGVQSREGCLIFMTTNMREKLDSALTRPGRIDVSMEFGTATRSQVVRLRDRIAPAYQGDARELIGKTMAEVQQRLLEARTESRREAVA